MYYVLTNINLGITWVFDNIYLLSNYKPINKG